MRRGRPAFGVKHVDRLPGPEEERERLRLILETLFGETTVKEASRRLSVSPARFAELRRQALEGALAALAPGRPGRPRTVREDVAEVEDLRARVGWLEEELQISRVRTEIALALPRLLHRTEGKKGGSTAGRPGTVGGGRSVT